ncbi:hypothetical protein Tco_1297609 [Tanacetum coccineum]
MVSVVLASCSRVVGLAGGFGCGVKVTQSSNASAIDYTEDTDSEKFGFVLAQSLTTPSYHSENLSRHHYRIIADWVKQLTRQKGYTGKMVEEANGMCVRLVLIASGSFEEVCSRLEDLLDTLPTLLSDNEGLSKDDLVQWRFLRFRLLIQYLAIWAKTRRN